VIRSGGLWCGYWGGLGVSFGNPLSGLVIQPIRSHSQLQLYQLLTTGAMKKVAGLTNLSYEVEGMDVNSQIA